MLTLQIAAGIVLAYIIIVNQQKVLAVGRWLLGAAAFCLVIVAIGWAGSAAVQFAGSAVPQKVLGKLFILIGCVPLFALAASGSLGMMMLAGLLFGKRPERVLSAFTKLCLPDGENRSGCLFGIALVMVTVLINFGLSFPVWAYTPIGNWYDAVDAYGRANGWQDGLSVFFGMALWQWVWIPLGIYFLVTRLGRRQKRSDER